MRKLWLMLAFATACSRPLSFVEYREPSGQFTVQTPSDWRVDERGAFSRKPVGQVVWIGEMIDHAEGRPIGVMLSVTRLDRQSDPRATAYRKFHLAPSEELFTGTPPPGMSVTKAEFSGYPARWVTNDDAVQFKGDNLLHGPVKEFPSRVRALVIQTPDAYYVLNYTAVRDRFEKYLPAFETLTASFQLHKK